MLGGRLFESEGRHFAELPVIDFIVSGKSREEVLTSVYDQLKNLVKDDSFEFEIRTYGENERYIFITSERCGPLLGLILRHYRKKHNLSAKDLADRLGYASVSALAPYESGKVEASLSQALKLFKAINPNGRVTLRFSIDD
jgi:hypothetical protein